MKLIHTADLHLHSAFVQFPKEKAKLRVEETMQTFARLADFAKREQVYGVLIAGDLFDSNRVPNYVKRRALSIVAEAAPVRFFYITGNHDDKALDGVDGAPDNFLRFSKSSGFFTYELPENITVSGVDYAASGEVGVYRTLALPRDKFNIVLMHGTISSSDFPDRDAVCLPNLTGRNIDYLALGHIHNPPSAFALDSRGRYRYAGCLEGRGFDETGEKGAYLLEIKDGKLVLERFVKFSRRTVYEITVDVSGILDVFALQAKIMQQAINISQNDVVKVYLKGNVPAEKRGEFARVAALLDGRFFHFKIEDDTKTEVDIRAYEKDVSLRGEFVRNVSASTLPDSLRMDALAFGLAALAGEEIDV
jgi:DNA repair exonuclease SbcCD nuclease subunit